MKSLKKILMVPFSGLNLLSLELAMLFLTLLWLGEFSLLSEHMAGCKLEPTGPMGPQSRDKDEESAVKRREMRNLFGCSI